MADPALAHACPPHGSASAIPSDSHVFDEVGDRLCVRYGRQRIEIRPAWAIGVHRRLWRSRQRCLARVLLATRSARAAAPTASSGTSGSCRDQPWRGVLQARRRARSGTRSPPRSRQPGAHGRCNKPAAIGHLVAAAQLHATRPVAMPCTNDPPGRRPRPGRHEGSKHGQRTQIIHSGHDRAGPARASRSAAIHPPTPPRQPRRRQSRQAGPDVSGIRSRTHCHDRTSSRELFSHLPNTQRTTCTTRHTGAPRSCACERQR
jgi:hypothetical protein